MKETIENVWHKGALNEGGYLYLAYPKKGNKAYAESIHRDAIFPALQVDDATGLVPGTGLKFNRMVQLDEVFTVIGLKHEKDARRRTGPSQRVDDYKNRTVEIEVLLADHPKELAFYQSLTPSYKTDWARYVFSAVQNATREKRAWEMIEILGKGYKTKELYRKARVE